jgi:hypothetical protein
MNLLLNSALWRDYTSLETPPITWNAEHRRYEVLVSSPDSGTAAFYIEHIGPVAGSGHTVEMEYNFSNLDPNGFIDPYLAVIENGGTVVNSVNLTTSPTGTLEADLSDGNFYTIMLTNGPDSYYSANFFSIDGIIDPLGDAPYVPVVPPWWLCLAAEEPTDPPPVRIDPAVEFVDLKNYDADFRYPLASSRVPSKINREAGCVACAPELINAVEPEPEPEPEPEDPADVYVAFGEGTYTHEFGWDSGYNRELPVTVTQNGSTVATLTYQTFNAFHTWEGPYSDFDSTQPLTYSQGSWEISRMVVEEFLFFDCGVPQVFPTSSYRSSTLEATGGYSADFTIEITYEGNLYEVSQSVISGSNSWMYPSDFPVGLIGVPVVISQFGSPLSPNCFLWSKVHVPLVNTYSGVGDAWNQQFDANGFDHTINETFTLSRGGDTYTATRTGVPFSYQFEFSPTPPALEDDPLNPWNMEWGSGNALIRWINNV